jgi:hypothetical protein
MNKLIAFCLSITGVSLFVLVAFLFVVIGAVDKKEKTINANDYVAKIHIKKLMLCGKVFVNNNYYYLIDKSGDKYSVDQSDFESVRVPDLTEAANK